MYNINIIIAIFTMDRSIRTILVSSKQKWQAGHLQDLIISDEYQYPPKVRNAEEILISQYAIALKGEDIFSSNDQKFDKRSKIPLPNVFAYLMHILGNKKYELAVRLLQGSIDRKYVDNYHIVTYIVAKIYELAGQYRKEVFYLQNALKEQPFFNHAVFDLCRSYSLQFGRMQEAITILERHLSGKLANDRHIQSLYLFLCGKYELRNAKEVSKVMNGRSLTLSNYFNLALFLSQHLELQKAGQIFLDIITKLTKAKSTHSSSFTAKDRKMVIMAKVNLLRIYEKLSVETNRGQQQLCDITRSLLEQRSELDTSTIAKLQQTIAHLQQKQGQLGESYFSKLSPRYLQQKTELLPVQVNKQNKQCYRDEYSDFREYNNKKLKYLLMKQKQIDNFFKNIVVKKQNLNEKYKIIYKSIQKLKSGGSNQDSIVKQAKVNLNQEDIQLFQKQFEEKRKAKQLQFSNMQIQGIMQEIINNLSSCQPERKSLKSKAKPSINHVEQSKCQPIFLEQSKTARKIKTQNSTRNLRSDRSQQHFRIKPTIAKESKTITQNPIKVEQKEDDQIQLKLQSQVKDTPLQQNQQNEKQLLKEVSDCEEKESIAQIIGSTLEEPMIISPLPVQSMDPIVSNAIQPSDSVPPNIEVTKDEVKQAIIPAVPVVPIEEIPSVMSGESPETPISCETPHRVDPVPIPKQTPSIVNNESPTTPISCQTPHRVDPVLILKQTPSIVNNESLEPKFDPLMSSFQLTGINLNKSSFAKSPQTKNTKRISKKKSIAKFHHKSGLKNQLMPLIKEQAKSQFQLQIDNAQKLISLEKYDKAFEIYTQMYKQFKEEAEKQLIMLKIAEVFEKQNKFMQAQKTYLKCTKFNNVAAFFKLGSLLLRNGRIKSGVENLQKANCIKRNDIQIQNKLIYGYSLQQQTMQKALNMAHAILRKEPQSLQTLIMIANILEKQGKVKSAIEIMIAIDQCKSAQYIKHYLGVLHLEDSNISQAFNYFKEALNLKADYVPSLVEVATIISDISPKQSIQILKKVLQIEPTNRKALARLGKIYESIENDFDNAMATYRAALEAQENYESYIKIGDCLVKQQSYIQALVNYQQAIALRKTHDGFAKVASMYEKKGEYQKGIENYQQALNLLSKQKENNNFTIKKQYLIAMGKLNLLIYDYDTAISAFEDVLEQEESLEIFKLIADAQFGKKQFTISLEYYEKANQLAKGENIQILQNIAICFDKMEEYLASKAIYEKILQKDPQNTKCMNNLANILLITGETNQAFYLFETMLQKVPKNLEKRLKLAQIYAFVGDWSKVEYHLLQCYHQKQNDPLIIQKLINLYKQKRDTKLINKYEKKLILLKDSHKHHKQDK